MSLRYGAALRWSAPLRAALLLFSLGLIAAGSLLPASMTPSTPALGVVYALNLAHVLLYGALAVTLALAVRAPLPQPRALLLLLLAVGLVGWLDEWHQGTRPYRDSSLWDLGSDLLGGLLALLVAAWSDRPGGLRARKLPLALLAAAALTWNLLPTLGPDLRPLTP